MSELISILRNHGGGEDLASDPGGFENLAVSPIIGYEQDDALLFIRHCRYSISRSITNMRYPPRLIAASKHTLCEMGLHRQERALPKYPSSTGASVTVRAYILLWILNVQHQVLMSFSGAVQFGSSN